MVSLLHESILESVRNYPMFGVAVTDIALYGQTPSFTDVETIDSTFNEIAPIEYRADAVLMLRDRRRPVLGIVVESQLKPDADKSFTWPLYAATARARYRCPFVITVITPSSRTERWANAPIDLGGGNRFRPLVVGPSLIPKVADVERARREPQLAMLSAMAHGRREVELSAAIGSAAVRGAWALPEPERLLHWKAVIASLSEAARKAIDMELDIYKLLDRAQRKEYRRAEARGLATGEARGLAKGKAQGLSLGKAEGRAEGKAQGLAMAVTTILEQRELRLTAEHRRQILGCRDQRKLDSWLKRATSVNSVAELLAPHTRTARSPRSRVSAAAGRARRAAR